VESAVDSVLGVAMMVLPLDTINAIANTVTAVAVLWAARSLRNSLTDVRMLNLQPPLSPLPPLSRKQRERLWRDLNDQRQADEEDLS
jgi:hypothetical protein